MGVQIQMPFEFSAAYLPFSLALGITPSTTAVEVTSGTLVVRFGLWRLVTPLGNVAAAEVTGPYSFLKTAGPPHLSFADRGVSFATNGRKGTCIHFRQPVAAIAPFGLLAHPAATVTVAEPERLATLLGQPMEGVRPLVV